LYDKLPKTIALSSKSNDFLPQSYSVGSIVLIDFSS